MGILLAWIVQKRWLTLSAFALLLVGAIVLPRFSGTPSYVGLVLGILFLMAVLYEALTIPRLRLSRGTRLAYALWMGFSASLLMVGIVVSGSNSTMLFAVIALFAVLGMSGTVALMLVYRQGLGIRS